jgi:hypothetical protein
MRSLATPAQIVAAVYRARDARESGIEDELRYPGLATVTRVSVQTVRGLTFIPSFFIIWTWSAVTISRERVIVRANPARRVDRRSKLTHGIGVRHVPTLRRSLALCSFYGPLKLRDKFLAQKWRSTLTVGCADTLRCALTRFLGH